jgi:hypothetical protein
MTDSGMLLEFSIKRVNEVEKRGTPLLRPTCLTIYFSTVTSIIYSPDSIHNMLFHETS